MNEFHVGQILVHSEIPEIGRLKVGWLSGDRIRVALEFKRDGESAKTFALPNEHLKPAKDQSSAGFEAAKPARAKSAKAKARRAATTAELPS